MSADAATASDITAWLRSKAAHGRLDGSGGALSGSSVRRLYIVLSAGFRWAVAQGWLPRSPMDNLRAPSGGPVRDATERAWTVDQLRTFLVAVAGERLAPAFRLAAVTGCRRGELLGLRWRDVQLPDIGGSSVTFKQTIVVVDGHPLVKPNPKNASSVRRVPIDEDTAAALAGWKGVQAAERDAWGDGWHDHGLVFTREDGSPVRPDWFTKRFVKLVNVAGLPRATPHDLRHTAATMMLENGVPAKVVADVLGHGSTRVTQDTYQAVVERLGRDAVSGIAVDLG